MNAPVAAFEKRARRFLPQSLLSSLTKRGDRTAELRPEAVTLLSEIMARLHGVDMPVVQFISASGEPGATVAHSFAQASARCLGRTLLIRVRAADASHGPTTVATAVATIPRRRARKTPTDTLDIVSDSTVAGLYHARFECNHSKVLQIAPTLPDAWLDGVSLDFRLIVIESDAPERCPATLDLATRCHGSVLVVTAGVTGLPQARRVMRQVEIVGGTLLGSVLDAAPPILRWTMPSWFGRPAGGSAG